MASLPLLLEVCKTCVLPNRPVHNCLHIHCAYSALTVWGAILAGILKIQDDPRTTVGFVLGKMTLIFVFCYIFCGAGMVWNDWVDRDIDAHVERTKNRPLASGRMTTSTSITWIGVQYVVAYGILHYMLEGTHV